MRQFIASTNPDKKGKIALTEKEQRYLISVLRLKDGSLIDVSLPEGCMIQMQLNSSKNDGKKNPAVELLVVSSENLTNNEQLQKVDCPQFILFQILPKLPKMDLIVRQATECGACLIIPIIGEYSVMGKTFDKKDSANKVARWERIVREARQQSGSTNATKIMPPCSIDDAMKLWNSFCDGEKKGFVLREKDDNQKSFFRLLENIEDIKNCKVGMVIGCEGGISPAELDILEKNEFCAIHLKTNILRAETAALYTFAVLQTAVMEFNEWRR